MTGDEVRALRTENPLSDLDALLGMEDDALDECVTACRDLYGPAFSPGHTRGGRAGRIAAVLMSRARYAGLTDSQRAAIVVDDRGGPNVAKEGKP